MSKPENQLTDKPAAPPPLPPAVIPYLSPNAPSSQPDNASQKVFDTVIGPNMRLHDNLIQLACLAVGVILGAGIGAAIGASRNLVGGIVIGGFGGLVLALLLSGFVIGIIRALGARPKK